MGKKIAIITGASGGIGREFARLLAAEEIDEVWAIARNPGKLDTLRSELGGKVIGIAKDLTKITELNEIGELLKNTNSTLSYLVNNAGAAKMGSWKEFTAEELAHTISLNCTAMAVLCRICIPFMDKGSRILNISSASAFQPNPYINLYASTKAFERSYSRALNVELKPLGVTVTAVCPSWVDTEMLTTEINGQKVKFPGIVTTEEVAKKAVKDAKKGKDMSVCSFYVKCQHLLVKLMPQKWTMKLWMRGVKKYIQEN